MNDTIDSHTSSSTISDNRINDTTKCITNTNDNNIPIIHKKLKSKNTLLITVNKTQSIKKQKNFSTKKKHLINNNIKKKFKQYSHSNLELIPSTSTNIINHCNICDEYHNEMISCNTCSATFHHHCINRILSKDDILKNSYSCENCRSIKKNKQQKIIQPFSFSLKKYLNINKFKKHRQYHSTLGQIKLPIASNGQSLVQPSGKIKFRAINNNRKSKHLPSSTVNLKRKRTDSSTSSINSSTCNSVKISNKQLETLHHLFLSCQSEEFHGPSLLLNNSMNYIQKYCFICRKSSTKQGPSIHCDYCPLIYHLDCLTPSMISLPLSNEKWMCPNHMEPILDRYFLRKKTFFTNERVKIYQKYSQIKQNTILQEFTHIKRTKNNLLLNTINKYQLEPINISQIPKSIEEFYFKANIEQKQINENIIQTSLPLNQSSFSYDPCIWNILQSILNHIVNNDTYEFSSKENNYLIKSQPNNECNNFNTIDTLLQALNKPDDISEQITINNFNTFPTSTNSFSFLIDLSQFRLSHAALIHLHSKHIIYIQKHVIWFGSSSLNDICLKDFNHFHPCQYISERHACLYYDQKRNLFELLNYSEYGTIINNIRYGFDTIIDDNKQENENFEKCFCLKKSLYHSAWDGSAQIEQGTVIKIGCHEFLFYRHVVR